VAMERRYGPSWLRAERRRRPMKTWWHPGLYEVDSSRSSGLFCVMDCGLSILQ